MTTINIYLKRWHEQILKEIEAIRAGGDVAPEGISIVTYYSGKKRGNYVYYRLVAAEPIFEGRNGKKTNTRHLGAAGSLKTISAINTVKRRRNIKLLEKLSVQIEQTLYEMEVMEVWAKISHHFLKNVTKTYLDIRSGRRRKNQQDFSQGVKFY